MILINSSPKDALKIFQPFLPIYVPVGIGCLLAVAERENIPAYYVDEQIEDDVLAAIAGCVEKLKPPYFFGFSVLTAAFSRSLEISRKLKDMYPDSVICFGGIHPTAVPEEVLAHGHIDIVVRGEGDLILPDLYRAVRDRQDFRHLPNVSYRSEGRVVHNSLAPLVADLNTLPSFPYHRFTSKKYSLGFVVSSRGCPYQCIFCSNRVTTGRQYRSRSTENILAEIDLLYHKYGQRQILFLDDNLLVNRPRIAELTQAIKNAGFAEKIIFNFQARGDNVDEELLKELYDAGFRSVFFGLETASEKLMKLLKKGETVTQCMDAVKMARGLGFHVSATFIYALPQETHVDRMNCLKLAKELRLDMVRFNNATPYPGTELYRIALAEGRLKIQGEYENFNSVSTFIENPLKPIPFSYVPEGNTESQIRRDILISYFSFYMDVRRLKSIFTKPELGVGWFSAGERIFDFIKKIPSLLVLGGMFVLKFGQLLYYVSVRKETKLTLSQLLSALSSSGLGEDRDEIGR